MTDQMQAEVGHRFDGHPVVMIPISSYFTRLHWRIEGLGRLPMWTVYRPTTREYPGRWVARMHVALPQPRPTRFVLGHFTLDKLREILPSGLTNIGRQPGDAAEIEEVWI